jgi:hypothetical protein
MELRQKGEEEEESVDDSTIKAKMLISCNAFVGIRCNYCLAIKIYIYLSVHNWALNYAAVFIALFKCNEGIRSE